LARAREYKLRISQYILCRTTSYGRTKRLIEFSSSRIRWIKAECSNHAVSLVGDFTNKSHINTSITRRPFESRNIHQKKRMFVSKQVF
jgi:hypothetical protein